MVKSLEIPLSHRHYKGNEDFGSTAELNTLVSFQTVCICICKTGSTTDNQADSLDIMASMTAQHCVLKGLSCREATVG